MNYREMFNKKGTNSLQKQYSRQLITKDNKKIYPSVILRDKLSVEIWKPDYKPHEFDIIPFPCGKNFPIDIQSGEKIHEEGEFVYTLDIIIHRGIGPLKKQFVCPQENFGLPCPVCEFMDSTRLEKDDWARIHGVRTNFYLVWVKDSVETKKKGLQLFEIPYHFMENHLATLMRNKRGGGVIDFSHPDTGKSIYFEKIKKGEKGTEFKGHELLDRDVKLRDELLNLAFPIDDFIHMRPTYEEIEEAFKGQSLKMSSGTENAGKNFSGDDDLPDFMKPTNDDVPEQKPKTFKLKLKL